MYEHLVAVVQRIPAGSQFNGLAPATVPVDVDGIRWFPADVNGGLFEFDLDSHIDIAQLQIDFGGQSTWSLSMTDGAEEFPIESGTTEVSYYKRDLVTIPKGWKLKLVTTGASSAMGAMVWYRRSPIV